MKNIGIAIRSLFKRGQHNVKKIISLGIGLTIGLVLIAKVHFENTYDNFYPDGDRIYRVYEKFFMNGEVGDHGQTPAGVIPLLKQETGDRGRHTLYVLPGKLPFYDVRQQASAQSDLHPSGQLSFRRIAPPHAHRRP